jgi:serine/threonine protein kinase
VAIDGVETEVLLGGRYRLGERIGSGGMADVHRALDTRLGRPVAIKLMRSREATQTDRDRFAAEARVIADLNHPGIVTLLDSGLDDDRPYLVMELVEGPTLAQRLAEGPLPGEEVRRIGAQLASALAYAHAQGVVHRDVKPGNVLLGPEGRACLADFGIARQVDGTVGMTLAGQVIGSPAYVAPEQVAAEPVGPPADVYSLGLLLFESLTGRRAFTGTGVEVAYARVHGSPMLPVSLGPMWLSLLAAMTARDPAERPTAESVVRLLAGPPAYDAASTAAFSTDVRPVRPARPASPARGRVLGVLPAALVAALALVGVLLAVPWLTSEHGPAASARTAPPTTAATRAVQQPTDGTSPVASVRKRVAPARKAPRPHARHAPPRHRKPPAHVKPHPKPHHGGPGHGHAKH